MLLLIGSMLLISCRLSAVGTTPVPTVQSYLDTATPCIEPVCIGGAPSPVAPETTPKSRQNKVSKLASTLTPASHSLLVFSHVIIIMLENHEYGKIVGDTQLLPNFQQLIKRYALLTDYYAITHPSLPNYLALIGGDTFGIQSDCTNCFISAPSLPDGIEASGRTWRNYAEDMPSACFLGRNGKLYTQVINPFIYFNLIRQNPVRCDQNVLPLVKSNFKDGTPYSHYSLLKTIETSWGLPLLGHAADPRTHLILAPWVK